MVNVILTEKGSVKINFGQALVALFLILMFSATIVLGIKYAITDPRIELVDNTTTSLSNGTEYYSRVPFFVNISTNSSASRCGYIEYSGANHFVVLLTNSTSENTTWTNNSATNFTFEGVRDNSPNRNITFVCNNTVWANNSATANMTFFQINERSPNSLLLRLRSFTNGSTYQRPIFNVSSNETVSTCVAYENNVSTTTTLANYTDGANNTRLIYTNSSAIVLSETLFNLWTNVTTRCDDAFGNASWYNTSSAVGNWTQIRIDRTTPLTSGVGDTVSIANDTRNVSFRFTGNYLDVEFNITDRTPQNCWVRRYKNEVNITPTILTDNLFGTILNSSKRVQTGDGTTSNTEQAYCKLNITGGNFTSDGFWTIGVFANDTAGLTGTQTNYSYVVTKLVTGWNQVSYWDNTSFSSIANNHSNISQVAFYNNLPTFKNFTTFVAGLGTNANAPVNMVLNATWVYATVNSTLVRPYNAVTGLWTNDTLFMNGTNTKSPWNLVTYINISRTSMNATFYNDGMISNGTVNAITQLTTTSANITSIAVYNATMGKYCTGIRGYKTTSCYPQFNVTDIYFERTHSVWFNLNQNATLIKLNW